MLRPEYLQTAPNALLELWSNAEMQIINAMAKRLIEIDYLNPSAVTQTQILKELGWAQAEITSVLSKITTKSEKEIDLMLSSGVLESLNVDDEIYKSVGLDPQPINQSTVLSNLYNSGYEQTRGLFVNLAQTTVSNGANQFIQVLDNVIFQTGTGSLSPTQSVTNAIKSLSQSGLASITYPSGKRDFLEVAVRRASVTGLNQLTLKMQDARADEMGSDLVKVSAHAGARPDHAEWQGGIYSRSGNSTKYPSLVVVTGYGTGAGLGGWNCSHSYRPYFDGMPRTYSKDLLNEYEAKNISYNGKMYTEFEALGIQRSIERNIRKWEREKNALKSAGLASVTAQAKLNKWNTALSDFTGQTGLKKQEGRLIV